MGRTVLGLVLVLLPFAAAGVIEWRRNRRAFRNLPEPQEQAKRYATPGSL